MACDGSDPARVCDPHLRRHPLPARHLVRLVQPLLVVITQGAHFQTFNGLGELPSVVIDLHRASIFNFVCPLLRSR